MEHTVWARVQTKPGRENIKYIASISGDILIQPYTDTAGRVRKAKMPKIQTDKKGYARVDSRVFGTPMLHRMVYASFYPIGEGLQINHIDGDKQNNKIENLETVTCKENIQHAIRIGLREPFLRSTIDKSATARTKHGVK